MLEFISIISSRAAFHWSCRVVSLWWSRLSEPLGTMVVLVPVFVLVAWVSNVSQQYGWQPSDGYSCQCECLIIYQ
jgi:hypothetical protein